MFVDLILFIQTVYFSGLNLEVLSETKTVKTNVGLNLRHID